MPAVEGPEQVAMHFPVERLAYHQRVPVRLLGLVVLAQGDLDTAEPVEIVDQRRVERPQQFGADFERDVERLDGRIGLFQLHLDLRDAAVIVGHGNAVRGIVG
jgi:hypothetical protein